jgi:hypothetical protein
MAPTYREFMDAQAACKPGDRVYGNCCKCGLPITDEHKEPGVPLLETKEGPIHSTCHEEILNTMDNGEEPNLVHRHPYGCAVEEE